MCYYGCNDFIVEYLEVKFGKSIVLDEILVNGLFNYFVFGELVLMLCIDEVYLFLIKIFGVFKLN